MNCAITCENNETVSNEKKVTERIPFVAGMTIFFILLFIKNVVELEIPVMILTLFYGCLSIFCDRDEMIALIASCVALYSAFQYKYAIGIIIIVYLIRFPKSVKRGNVFLPVFAMLAWELLHCFDPGFSVLESIRLLIDPLACAFIISFQKNKFNYNFIARTVAICTSAICSLILIELLVESNFNFYSIFSSGNYRFGFNDPESPGYVLNYNANSIGFLANLSISSISLIFARKQQKKIDYCLGLICIFYGVLTLSRTFLFCLACMFIVYWLSSGIRLGKVMKYASIICLFVLVLNFFMPYIFENIVNRFETDDVTNGRADLLIFYFDHIFSSAKYLSLGIGMQFLADKLKALYPCEFIDVPHNAIQEIIIGWGVVGLVLFTVFLIILISEAKRQNKKLTLFNFLPLVLTLVCVQAGQLITSSGRMLAFVVIYIALTTTVKKESMRSKNEN